MITKDEKTAMRKFLGHRYSAKVLSLLNAKGVVDTSGKLYSSQMIRQVFNGYCESLHLEEAILEVVKNEKIKRRKLQKQKQAIS